MIVDRKRPLKVGSCIIGNKFLVKGAQDETRLECPREVGSTPGRYHGNESEVLKNRARYSRFKIPLIEAPFSKSCRDISCPAFHTFNGLKLFIPEPRFVARVHGTTVGTGSCKRPE
ncbi:hypothetical protein ES702_00254 [subsurface metagenome]